jgi:poly(3-hydroxybutyrate) depolymerase
MGDKQEYLRAAIPDLIDQLINPTCVDPTSNAVVGVSSNGACVQGQLAFAPVHDMHLGIVSSALGARLGDACSPQAMALAPFSNLLAHNDDEAHLLDRTLTYTEDGGAATEGTLANASSAPDVFLYWYPTQGNTAPAGPGIPVVRASSDAGSNRSSRAGTASSSSPIRTSPSSTRMASPRGPAWIPSSCKSGMTSCVPIRSSRSSC